MSERDLPPESFEFLRQTVFNYAKEFGRYKFADQQIHEGDSDQVKREKMGITLWYTLLVCLTSGRAFDLGTMWDGDQPLDDFIDDSQAILDAVPLLRHPYEKPYVFSSVYDGTRTLVMVAAMGDKAEEVGDEFHVSMFGWRRESRSLRLLVSAIANPREASLKELTLGNEVVFERDLRRQLIIFAASATIIVAHLLTTSVTRTVVTPSKETVKNRRLMGRPPLPVYTRVDTGDYKTMIAPVRSAAAQGASHGGTHASPIEHDRRAHRRVRKATGKEYWVRACKVNVGVTGAPPRQRSHYEVRAP